MKFVNEVIIHAPPDELFEFVSDIERVAPCLPGAEISGRDGEDYLGSMKVKVGPILAAYQGTITFLELDRESRRAVMKARADEVAGNGGAEAQITTSIEETDEGSLVKMETDLQIRGRVAQFGRGAMEKISERMIKQFAQNIEQAFAPAEEPAPPAEVANGHLAPPAEPPPPAPKPSPAAPAAATEPLDAFGLVAGPGVDTVRRAAPYALVALAVFLYGYLVGRLRQR